MAKVSMQQKACSTYTLTIQLQAKNNSIGPNECTKTLTLTIGFMLVLCFPKVGAIAQIGTIFFISIYTTSIKKDKSYHAIPINTTPHQQYLYPIRNEIGMQVHEPTQDHAP